MTTIIQITDSLGSATPSAINNSGEVVGNIVGATGAWIWKNGLTTNLGALPGDNYIYAASINSSGQVVGYSEPSATADLTVDGLGPQLIAESHAFLWQNGVMTDLNPLIGQTFSSAVGINDAGNIAVEAAGTESLGAVNVTISYVTGAYDLVNGVASSLPGIPLESSITTAIYGINNSNQVVGEVNIATLSQLLNGGQITEHAAIWTNGERTDLGTLPGDTQSAAFAINNTGVVVGISNANYSVQNGNGWNPQAVVWVNDVISALPNLPNATGSEALAVNSSGHIVGFCYTEEYLYNTFSFAESPLACIWENGKVIDLNSLLPENSGWVLQEATGINDNDQIIGTGTYDGAFSAFVLNLGATGAVITNTTGQQTTLTAPAPNTPIQGGGYDVLSLSQNAIASASSAYSITANADGSFTLATTGSSDHVSGVIQIQFADKTLTIATANSFNEYVALLYQGALGRTPDAGGLAGWEQLANALPTSELATGVYALSNFSGNYNTTLSIAAGFTNSAEFEAKYGSLSNLQFVTQLYSNILDRAPDSGGAD